MNLGCNVAELDISSSGVATSGGDGIVPVVTEVYATEMDGTTLKPDATYGSGSVIGIVVRFNENITVTGTPQIMLNGSISPVNCSLHASLNDAIQCNYTAVFGDGHSDLDYLNTSALSFNGGAIRDSDSQLANLTLPAPSGVGSVSDDQDIVVATGVGIVPLVTEVYATETDGTTLKPNATYEVGSVIGIVVRFSENITVTGTPQIMLNSSIFPVNCVLHASLSDAIQCNYTVRFGDGHSDLDYLSTTALSFNGGAIRDSDSQLANLLLPAPNGMDSISDDQAIVVTFLKTVATSDAAAGDRLGGGLDITGNWAVITSMKDDSSGVANAGSVYLYNWNGTTWTQFTEIARNDVGSNSTHTYPKIDGEWMQFNVPYVSINGAGNSGIGYFYRFNGTTWNFHSTVTRNDAGGGNLFFHKIEGNRAISGARDASAPGDTDDTSKGGLVYIWDFDGTNWIPYAGNPLKSPRTNPWFFGEITDIRGNLIVVGARPENRAHIYRFDGTTWNLEDSIAPAESGLAGSLSWAGHVQINNNFVFIGAPAYSTNRGAIVIFKYDGVSNWALHQVLLASDGVAGDGFGWDFDLQGNRLLAASADFSTSTGKAYAFEYNGATGLWAESNIIYNPTPANGDKFGVDVALSGSWGVIGAEYDDNSAGADAGAFYFRSFNLNTAPKVTQVAAVSPNGAYVAGNTIDIDVTFNQTVNVTNGSPLLRLETGNIDRNATYLSGSGTNTLRFRYVVQAGDSSTDLNYFSIESLYPNLSNIRNSSGVEADLVLPDNASGESLSGNSNISI